MGRSGKLSAEVCIDVGGKLISYLEIDKEGRVTMLVSDEEQQQYEQKMLQNIGEGMSRFYTAHPEYLKDKEEEKDERKKPA